ncbi:calcyphosin [Trypanosoma conorhini]|uniref:Calcyphosin n=1 Tax=Trypanosoma conorhini TaxID=83891 RepID=A0A422Q963_9TRYP|nr:calcyphosin [Trypanosoma conorhini]RNF26484.1 calcyphosin [Trypanosoma conorhini]
MIGGQHTKERLSERLQDCQNQPKNRGYLPGTKLLTGGYSTRTLQGNWAEERADAGYYDGEAALPTHLASVWTTDYRTMTGNVSGTVSRPVFDQATLMDIVDRKHRAYPAHQPHLDQQHATLMQERFKTVTGETYTNPEETKRREELYVPPIIGRTPTAQAKAVILRFQRQLLLSRHGESAFPGNILRQVRLSLERSDTVGEGMLTVEEAQQAFAEASLTTNRPECVALVRAFDLKGDGTVSIAKIMEELRGELRDRRYSLVEKVYEMLKGFCPDGILRLQRLVELIDVDSMNAVISGRVTSSRAHGAFVEQWDLPNEAYISFETFLVYFMNASFEIDSDQEFEVFMRNVWHLSGGNGKSMNTSCRRVRVVHRNGRITTEEVKNDLYIKDGDPNMMERIIENLASWGIKDVARAEVLPREL